MLMEMDLVVAAEIGQRIAEQHDEAKKRRANAKDAVGRRNQRRASMDGKGLGQLLKDTLGVDETGGDE